MLGSVLDESFFFYTCSSFCLFLFVMQHIDSQDHLSLRSLCIIIHPFHQNLYLEHLRSNLVHMEPYNILRPRLHDVQSHLEYAKPWIGDCMSSFRGLQPRGRTTRCIFRILVIFCLVILFIVSWAIFLRRGEFSSASRRLEPDHSVFNTTLGVCLPAEKLVHVDFG